jgi:hypothetical protein
LETIIVRVRNETMTTAETRKKILNLRLKFLNIIYLILEHTLLKIIASQGIVCKGQNNRVVSPDTGPGWVPRAGERRGIPHFTVLLKSPGKVGEPLDCYWPAPGLFMAMVIWLLGHEKELKIL